ncbi:hypothetical protein T11_10538 [Trichinella zimbabwensis]|uniref:Uncharacterized protein n=1 Tax=Trichinella zimbabwensis TaxID=268475 RepID=A0A0V1G7S0_9BILA|nr:hypothetical protein T11_10538 [Trichinella zimbabwensis]
MGRTKGVPSSWLENGTALQNAGEGGRRFFGGK